jgi:3-demethoxyubiquinol 3-hydroxylase
MRPDNWSNPCGAGLARHFKAMNAIAPALPDIAIAEMPSWLIGELRSDHAGETGAVMIYRGILAFCKDPAIRDFAERHGATEQGHLDLLNALLPQDQHSKLLPIWRIAGWMTGAIPALFGPRAVYATIDAVESFVDHHYQQQLDRLEAEALFPPLQALLRHCQEEEIHHRDEAREAGEGRAYGPLISAWAWVVGAGSKAAVVAAKRI